MFADILNNISNRCCAQLFMTTKGPGTSFLGTVSVAFIIFSIYLAFSIYHLLPDCGYFPSYLVKSISCLLLRNFMTSWNLISRMNFWSEIKKLLFWFQNKIANIQYTGHNLEGSANLIQLPFIIQDLWSNFFLQTSNF